MSIVAAGTGPTARFLETLSLGSIRVGYPAGAHTRRENMDRKEQRNTGH